MRNELCPKVLSTSPAGLLLTMMFSQVAVAVLLLAGITAVYVFAIRHTDPHGEADRDSRRDRRPQLSQAKRLKDF
jgi:hypothetical protein